MLDGVQINDNNQTMTGSRVSNQPRFRTYVYGFTRNGRTVLFHNVPCTRRRYYCLLVRCEKERPLPASPVILFLGLFRFRLLLRCFVVRLDVLISAHCTPQTELEAVGGVPSFERARARIRTQLFKGLHLLLLIHATVVFYFLDLRLQSGALLVFPYFLLVSTFPVVDQGLPDPWLVALPAEMRVVPAVPLRCIAAEPTFERNPFLPVLVTGAHVLRRLAPRADQLQHSSSRKDEKDKSARGRENNDHDHDDKKTAQNQKCAKK
mmetsp:Transcript_39598/g.66387  ORF Transcript_39598/g.66387 Transcript_39598/m.66387 type:complete len:264 (-) Transcript_39598:36-827(-)